MGRSWLKKDPSGSDLKGGQSRLRVWMMENAFARTELFSVVLLLLSYYPGFRLQIGTNSPITQLKTGSV